jgi:hypothetical protein
MPRKKENAVRDLKQVLVRVPEDAYRVFEVARVAYQHRSIQELLRPVLEQHAETLRAKPQIQAMLRSSADMAYRPSRYWPDKSGTYRPL